MRRRASALRELRQATYAARARTPNRIAPLPSPSIRRHAASTCSRKSIICEHGTCGRGGQRLKRLRAAGCRARAGQQEQRHRRERQAQLFDQHAQEERRGAA